MFPIDPEHVIECLRHLKQLENEGRISEEDRKLFIEILISKEMLQGALDEYHPGHSAN